MYDHIVAHTRTILFGFASWMVFNSKLCYNCVASAQPMLVQLLIQKFMKNPRKNAKTKKGKRKIHTGARCTASEAGSNEVHTAHPMQWLKLICILVHCICTVTRENTLPFKTIEINENENENEKEINVDRSRLFWFGVGNHFAYLNQSIHRPTSVSSLHFRIRFRFPFNVYVHCTRCICTT